MEKITFTANAYGLESWGRWLAVNSRSVTSKCQVEFRDPNEEAGSLEPSVAASIFDYQAHAMPVLITAGEKQFENIVEEKQEESAAK